MPWRLGRTAFGSVRPLFVRRDFVPEEGQLFSKTGSSIFSFSPNFGVVSLCDLEIESVAASMNIHR